MYNYFKKKVGKRIEIEFEVEKDDLFTKKTYRIDPYLITTDETKDFRVFARVSAFIKQKTTKDRRYNRSQELNHLGCVGVVIGEKYINLDYILSKFCKLVDTKFFEEHEKASDQYNSEVHLEKATISG